MYGNSNNLSTHSSMHVAILKLRGNETAFLIIINNCRNTCKWLVKNLTREKSKMNCRHKSLKNLSTNLIHHNKK